LHEKGITQRFKLPASGEDDFLLGFCPAEWPVHLPGNVLLSRVQRWSLDTLHTTFSDFIFLIALWIFFLFKVENPQNQERT